MLLSALCASHACENPSYIRAPPAARLQQELGRLPREGEVGVAELCIRAAMRAHQQCESLLVATQWQT